MRNSLLFAAVALGVSFSACAQKPQPGPARALGSIIQYQEKPVGILLYFEEKDATVSSLADPVPGSRREELPAFGSVGKPQAPTRPATSPRAARPKAVKG